MGEDRVGGQVLPCESNKLLHEVQETQVLVEVFGLKRGWRALEHFNEQTKRQVVSGVVDNGHLGLHGNVGQESMGGEVVACV